MKESTGSVASIYIVIFFIVIIFGFVASILNYYKTYKINNAITGAIEDYGGFSNASKEEIEKRLNTYGYKRLQNIRCEDEGLVAIDNNGNVTIRKNGDGTNNRGYTGYCVNIVSAKNENDAYEYYYYKVKTAFGIDFSFGATISLPVTTKTATMYSCFGLNCQNES